MTRFRLFSKINISFWTCHTASLWTTRSREARNKKRFDLMCERLNLGGRGGGRTRTEFPPREFKSLAAANYATRPFHACFLLRPLCVGRKLWQLGQRNGHRSCGQVPKVDGHHRMNFLSGSFGATAVARLALR